MLGLVQALLNSFVALAYPVTSLHWIYSSADSTKAAGAHASTDHRPVHLAAAIVW
jgi:hypothetical protein